MGVLEGLKELKSKHLTWKKVIKNRLDDSAEHIWSEKCLVEVHTGMEVAGVLKGNI